MRPNPPIPVALVAPDRTARPARGAAERRADGRTTPERAAERRIAGLAALRAAAALPGVDGPERLELVRRPGRAPRVHRLGEAGGRPLPLRVAVTHRDGGGAGAAVLEPLRVGIDLERDDGVRRGHERYFLTAREARRLPELGAAALWALKEAAWKALECGADVPFTALELRFGGDGRLRGIALDGRVRPARGRLLRVPPRHLLAVVCTTEARR